MSCPLNLKFYERFDSLKLDSSPSVRYICARDIIYRRHIICENGKQLFCHSMGKNNKSDNRQTVGRRFCIDRSGDSRKQINEIYSRAQESSSYLNSRVRCSYILKLSSRTHKERKGGIIMHLGDAIYLQPASKMSITFSTPSGARFLKISAAILPWYNTYIYDTYINECIYVYIYYEISSILGWKISHSSCSSPH